MKRLCVGLWVLLAVFGFSHSVSAAPTTAAEFFETSIRPLLVKHCLTCHNSEKQSGGLRLDSRAGLLKGGESGPAVVPKNSAESLLLQAVKREGGYEMPPDEPLSSAEVLLLEQWIKQGAVWPSSQVLKPEQTADRAKTHWAFQPLSQPAVPQSSNSGWGKNPIDSFVLETLSKQGLSPSPEADRRTLIRRLYYTLTGLPPSPEEVAAFIKDQDPLATERLVDRLLDSPHYGEHWARLWLDLARYADTKGYVYAREERFWVHAWAYRDWVVNALNRDLPYNRFLLLQLAGDQVPDRKPGDLAAMGFLTLGRRFLGVTHDIIDDRIDVVCRSTMALTVGCARCHDHKYDPIPTADYYSLYGVFDSCAEKLVPLSETPVGDEAYRKELETRQQKLAEQLAASRLETGNRVRGRIADYLKAQTELEKYPPQGFDQIFEKTDMLPAFVRRWEAYLRNAERQSDPVFRHWHAYRTIPADKFSEQAAAVTGQLVKSKAGSINRLVAEVFREPPESFDEVISRYAKLFSRIDQDWQSLQTQAKENGTVAPAHLPNTEAEALRRVLYGATAPCEVPDEPIVHIESYVDSNTCNELWKLQGEVDRWLIRSPFAAPYALMLADRPVPTEPRVFRRGDPAKKAGEVPRHFLSLLSGPQPKPFQHGSGRLELAEAIIDPANPLTARVIVNRVWAKHFGQGLVQTTSDFGLRADPPSHPELLDWLTQKFIAEGWSLKKLHRRILLSATFRQSSRGPSDPAVLAKANKLDPANRLLWRMNAHRLSFEEFRDSLLAATGQLDRDIAGKPVELLKPPFSHRRSLYGLVDRQFFPSTFRVFDVANPDLHIAERSETTVPQQSLFFLNHPLVLARTRDVVKTLPLTSTEQGITQLFRQVLGREPTASELNDGVQFLDVAQPANQPVSITANDWQYGNGFYDETKQQVIGFEKLPHFTGSAWQGGENWPDAKLGWVQLTADGGHPGNDRQHAAVRRWTAPRNLTVQIQSKLIHEASPGDGIRAFVIASRAGQLQAAKVHQQSAELNVDAISLQAGDTLDFLVDIDKVLNSDQYLWTVTLTELNGAETRTVWNSQTDFTPNQASHLTAWEQLAQVLFCSNEFLFVD